MLGFWGSKKQIWVPATCGLHTMLKLSSLVSENTVYFSFKWGIQFYFHNRHAAKIYHHPCFFHLVRKNNVKTQDFTAGHIGAEAEK